MKKSRFTETQIVKIQKEVESRRLVKEVCQEHGFSDATYFNWKNKYGGLEASDVKRLKELEDENWWITPERRTVLVCAEPVEWLASVIRCIAISLIHIEMSQLFSSCRKPTSAIRHMASGSCSRYCVDGATRGTTSAFIAFTAA